MRSVFFFFFGKHKKRLRLRVCRECNLPKKYDDVWYRFRVFRVVCSNFRLPILASYNILSRKMVSTTGILSLSFIVRLLSFWWTVLYCDIDLIYYFLPYFRIFLFFFRFSLFSICLNFQIFGRRRGFLSSEIHLFVVLGIRKVSGQYLLL